MLVPSTRFAVSVLYHDNITDVLAIKAEAEAGEHNPL